MWIYFICRIPAAFKKISVCFTYELQEYIKNIVKVLKTKLILLEKFIPCAGTVYIFKLIIDSVKLIIARRHFHFVKQFYFVFSVFFMIHILWIVTLHDFKFQNFKTRNTRAMLFGNITLAPGELVAGWQKAYVLGTTDSPFGYLVYESSKKAVSRDGKYPLLVFFLGGGERGNSEENNGILDRGASRLKTY